MRLTCRQLVDLVTEYLEGGLESRERLRFERHLGTCPACRVHVDQMRTTIALLGSLPQESISPEAERDLLDAFRRWPA